MDGIDKKIEPEGGAAITAKEENGLKKWNEDHTAYGKGVTVTAGEMVVLKKLLQSRNVF